MESVRSPFDMTTQFAGFTLDEIINHENTRYDSRLKTWPLGDEPAMFHCNEYRKQNFGTDWIFHMTYHDNQNSADWYFLFSIIPPRDTEIWLSIRGRRESTHGPIIAYVMSYGGKNFDSSIFSDLSPLPNNCQRLTDFMDLCGKVFPPETTYK